MKIWVLVFITDRSTQLSRSVDREEDIPKLFAAKREFEQQMTPLDKKGRYAVYEMRYSGTLNATYTVS